MLANTWRGNGWILAMGLTVSLIAPSLAEAQQGGLFPNLGVRRARTTCAAEDPVYKVYRHEFFGYHPTCWRKFPAGWGCPSPEAPNAAAEFQKVPRVKPADLNGPDDGANAPGAGDDGGMKGGQTPPNPTDLPLPDGDNSPFDLDSKPKPKPATPPAAAAPSTSSQPISPVEGLSPSSTPVTPTTSRTAPSADEPLLSLPEPDDSSLSGRAIAPKPAPTLPGSGSFNDPDPAAYHPPTTPPKRQTLLSSLFGGFGSRRKPQ